MPQTITFDYVAGLTTLTMRVFPDGSTVQVSGSPFACVDSGGGNYVATVATPLSGVHSFELYRGSIKSADGWINFVAPNGTNPVLGDRPAIQPGSNQTNALPGSRNEWRFWPNRGPITLRSLGLSGYTPYPVSDAKPRAISTREAAASGGVYTTQDRVWLIPAELISGTTPKLGDLIRTAANVDWTILSIDPLGKFGNTYRLTTRNLKLVAGLTQTARVLRPSTAVDSAGQRNPTFTEVYANLACKLQEQSHGLPEFQGGSTDRREYMLYVGTRLILLAGDVVEINSKRYDVVGSGSWDRIDQLGEVRLVRSGATP
jgi:hypothetical protein